MIWKHTYTNKYHWHKWFAWHPVQVAKERNGKIVETWAWWITVERKYESNWGDSWPEYRLI